MPTYIAAITPDTEGYLVSFLDFPELKTNGATLDAARIEAQGALEEHLATAFDNLPATICSLEDAAAKNPGALLIALTASQPKSRSVRINITIPEDILTAVDRSAKAHGMSRSRLLTKAVEATMTGQTHDGTKILLSDEILAAVDKSAKAHDMSRAAYLSKMVEASVTGKGHGGIKIPLSDEILAAVDRSAKAHDMNRIPLLVKLVEAGITGKGHGGIKIPLSDEVLAAVDKSAKAHDMNRASFLSGVIEVAVGLREGHRKSHGH